MSAKSRKKKNKNSGPGKLYRTETIKDTPKAMLNSDGIWLCCYMIYFAVVFIVKIYLPSAVPYFHMQRIWAFAISFVTGILLAFANWDVFNIWCFTFPNIRIPLHLKRACTGVLAFAACLALLYPTIPTAQLEKELGIKNAQIEFLQGQISRLQAITPSERAQELANLIPNDADSYTLALKAIAQRRFEDAWWLLDRAEAAKEVDPVKIYVARGRTRFYAGRYTDAAPWYCKAVRLAPRDADIINEAGLALIYVADYKEAELLLKRSLALRKRRLGPNHPDVAQSLNNIAILLCNQGKYIEAEPLYRRALEIDKKALSSDHPDVASILSNLAVLLDIQGKYAEAEPLYRRALEIWEKKFGPEHPDVAGSLNNLATLYSKQGKYTKAEPLYRRALKIWIKVLGSDHPDVAKNMNNLGWVLCKQGKYVDAEPLLYRALEIDEKALGSKHPDVADILDSLAFLYYDQGKYAKAEPLYRRALEIWEKALGPEHPSVAQSLNNLAALLRKTGRQAEAEKLEARARNILAQHAKGNPTI